jgi:hypothetical protein
MLDPIDLDYLALAIGPVQDSVVTNAETAEADKVVGHVRELVMDNLRTVLAKPNDSAEYEPPQVAVELLQIGVRRWKDGHSIGHRRNTSEMSLPEPGKSSSSRIRRISRRNSGSRAAIQSSKSSSDWALISTL